MSREESILAQTLQVDDLIIKLFAFAGTFNDLDQFESEQKVTV
jgi:hypothetical protein